MLRRCFISLAVILGCVTTSHAQASLEVMDPAGGLCSTTFAVISPNLCSSVVTMDRPVPWPWGLEQPFPWADIQGIWQVADADFNSYFALKVVKEKSTGERQLIVRQIDPDTCQVVATGVGYELNRVVRAQMTVTATGAVYRLALQAFREEDSPRPEVGKVTISQVMVMSLMDLDSRSDSLPVHVQIGKMSTSLDMKSCTEQKIR